MIPGRNLIPILVGVAFVACNGDGGGNGGMTDPPANRAPTAVIQADPTSVPEGDNDTTVVTLDGTASTDPDGDPLTFQWTAESGTFVNGTTATDATAQVTFPGLAPYAVTLTVSDGAGNTDTAMTTIDLDPPVVQNQAPTAVIVANPTSVPAGDNNQTVVTLDGSGSSDPEGGPLTFAWVATSGTFVNGTTASSTIAQVTFPGNSPYAVTLTVTDDQGSTATANTTIALGP